MEHTRLLLAFERPRDREAKEPPAHEVSIVVARDHPSLSMIDGLLYTKDGKKLLYVHQRRKGTLVLPEGVEEIHALAFQHCGWIDSIVLPSTMQESLHAGAFFGLSALRQIEIAEENEHFKAVDGVLFSKDGKKLIARPPMHGTEYRVPMGTEHIGRFAFIQNDMLLSVTMPASVRTIGDNAFYANTILKHVSLSPSLEDLGMYAFEDCPKIEKLVLPKGLVHVRKWVGGGEYAQGYHSAHRFDGTDDKSAAMEIWIPSTVETIETESFTYSKWEPDVFERDRLLVVEEGSYAHDYAIESSMPYCFPSEIALARQGFRYVILDGDAADMVTVYERPDLQAPSGSFAVGTAFLVLEEQADFYYGRLDGSFVYIAKDTCHIVTKRWDSERKIAAFPEVKTYAGPSQSLPVREVLEKDEPVWVYCEIGPWFGIWSAGGEQYVLKRDIMEEHSGYVRLPSVSEQEPVYAEPHPASVVVDMLSDGDDIRIKWVTADGWLQCDEGFVRTDNIMQI